MDNNNTTTQKKRGRPATGKKNEHERRVAIATSEENNLPQYGGSPDSSTIELLKEGISLIDTPSVDVYDFDAVKERTVTYLQRCVNLNRRPAIAAYALYLGLNRTALNNYVYGRSKAIDERSLALIKYVYSMVDASMEQQMTDGEMNVVAGIFLMRNNLSYTNVDTIEIVPRSENDNSINIEDVVNQYSTDAE